VKSRTLPLRGQSQVAGPKRIAGINAALFVPDCKPALTLFGRAVGKGMGHGAAAGIALQRVIPDLLGGIHCLNQIARFQHAKAFFRISRPSWF